MRQYIAANNWELMTFFGYWPNSVKSTDAFHADFGGLSPTEKLDLRFEVGIILETEEAHRRITELTR